MAMSDVENARGRPLAIWTIGFRPFFLMAGIWSAAALAGWIAMLTTGLTLPSRFDPLTWHIHEMLFGFVLAAIAGFLLTAIPNWTGRAPISGRPLAALAALWLTGRLACLMSASIPLWLAAATDLAFPFVLCAVVAREIIAGRNWRNMPMPVPIAVLGLADLLMYLELAGFSVPAGLGWRLGLAAIIVLISVVGGRIIPVFTRNWLVKQGAANLPAAHGRVDNVALGALHAGMIGWALFPALSPVGGLLLLAAALNLWRLVRWRGIATSAEPLLTVLHVGYLWVIVGAALLGASMLTAHVPEAAAIHALTAGAIGTMVLGVMTRVSLGHTGRALAADRTTALIYLLVILAAVARVAAAASGSLPMLIEISAALWIASFGLFALRYGPMLLAPRV
ncbi:NnrS [Nitrobacter hamburgensis X14]|uniref:NnrS n=1 Tax=Nitrobacter hamburgensis (strain DSM 10229 / NCIMB 13809 / X14) TaxID=323097 RepID=Q1QQG1_NITHX|nr:NnrS family protein [Nitrobacter hamburgensis]ABE61536.1 NnrS [Nitrobacter hamburgensis X14]